MKPLRPGILLLVPVCFGFPSWLVRLRRNWSPPGSENLPVDKGCFERYRGVCVPMIESVDCPHPDDRITWKGCSRGSICCYQKSSGTTPIAIKSTTPPPHHGACGISYVNGMASFRIVGGWDSIKGEWPWLASLYYKPESKHYCGLALIESDWVLTAAHCFMRDNEKDNYEVVLGEHLLNETEGEEQRFTVKKLIIHPDFDTSSKTNDFALIQLNKPVTFNKYVQRICLPGKEEKFEGHICTVGGWGYLHQFANEPSTTLQEVNLPILQHSECKQIFQKFSDTQMCAGFKHGMQDACGGDSGGPLMCKPFGTRLWKLAGVVSWGNGCAMANNPGVYTKVSSYLDWIKANIQ